VSVPGRESCLVRIVTDVARMAYIDSELEKRRPGGLPKSPTTSVPALPRSEQPPKKEIDVRTTAVGQGKLAEIDLGDEARLKNIVLTKQSLAGEPASPPKGAKRGVSQPLRSNRFKKKRTEEELNRDKMVEDLMRENRCMTPPASTARASLTLF
jgi:hypothetical protein